MARVWVRTVVLMFAASAAAPAQDAPPLPSAGECPCVPLDAAWSEPASNAWFAAGADAMLLIPRYESNAAYTATQIRPGPADALNGVRRIDEFGYDASFSPRLWAAAGVGGVGVRVTWLGFDQSAKPKDLVNAAPPLGSPVAANLVTGTSPLLAIATPVSLPAVNSVRTQGFPSLPPDRLSFTNSLEFDFWDFDATFSDLRIGRWELTAFGGMRYAYVRQTYDSFATGLPPQQLLSSQSFNGFGPTAGVEAQRPFGTLGLAAYGKVRFAFLFGADEHASRGETLGTIPPLALSTNDDASARQRYAPWVDLEMGVQWARRVGPVELCAHTGVFTTTFPLGSGPSGNGNIGLLGLSTGAGVRY